MQRIISFYTWSCVVYYWFCPVPLSSPWYINGHISILQRISYMCFFVVVTDRYPSLPTQRPPSLYSSEKWWMRNHEKLNFCLTPFFCPFRCLLCFTHVFFMSLHVCVFLSPFISVQNLQVRSWKDEFYIRCLVVVVLVDFWSIFTSWGPGWGLFDSVLDVKIVLGVP